jgi:hypothetical protein
MLAFSKPLKLFTLTAIWRDADAKCAFSFAVAFHVDVDGFFGGDVMMLTRVGVLETPTPSPSRGRSR